MADKKNKTTTKEAAPSKNKESRWEWVVAGIGAALVLATLGYLVVDSFLGTTPPDIAVTVTNVQTSGNRYLVQFEASNNGGEGAASVMIQGTLTDANGETETANASINYIAAGSRQWGGLYFSEDPSANELKVMAVGYEKP
jgi:uncharacterized protein (TIGR02588 family)